MPVKRRPSGYHQPLQHEEIASVLAEYGLGPDFSAHHVLFEQPTPVALGDRTKTARKLFADTASGAYFLKQIPWYCDEPSLNDYRQRWTEQLHAAGVPVPMPMRTVRGAAWAEINGARYVLTRSILGSAWVEGDIQLAAAMRLLASLHAAPPPTPELATQEDYFDLVADHIALAQDLLEEAGSDRERTLAAAFAPLLDDARHRALAEGWDTLPRTGIHGDFSPWNIVLSADGRHALACDFDNADFGQRLHDVVEAMFSFGLLRYRGKSTNFDSKARFEPIEAAARPLQFYQGVARLEPAERACLSAVAEAFAIEVYCLGLMRGDFMLAQLPTMLEELTRLRRDLPAICLVEPRAPVTAASGIPSFGEFHYDFSPWTRPVLVAISDDFGAPDALDRLVAFGREHAGKSSGRSVAITGSCSCPGDMFVRDTGPRMTASQLEPAVLDGIALLATASLGRSDAVVEAALRRVPVDPDDTLILAVCRRCGANADLATLWETEGRVTWSVLPELHLSSAARRDHGRPGNEL